MTSKLQDRSEQNQSAKRGVGRPCMGEEGKSPVMFFRLPEKMLAQVLELADKQKINKSQVMRDALTAYLGHPSKISDSTEKEKLKLVEAGNKLYETIIVLESFISKEFPNIVNIPGKDYIKVWETTLKQQNML